MRLLISVLSLLFGLASVATSQPSRPSDMVVIVSPKDGAPVPERPLIEGKVRNPKARVWVVIHPMEVADYWVQPSVTVRGDGAWRVQGYIGRPGAVDVGKHFEIVAIVNPKRPLKEGDVLPGWPDAEARSEVVHVTRR